MTKVGPSPKLAPSLRPDPPAISPLPYLVVTHRTVGIDSNFCDIIKSVPQDSHLASDIAKLRALIDSVSLPEELEAKATSLLDRLERQAQYGQYSSEFETAQHYIDWITHLPWTEVTKDNLDLILIRQIMDKNHYGLDELKSRFLEYVSVLVLNQKNATNFHAPVLLLVGLAGTGKTTLAGSIADALNRRFVRIPFGGMSSALDLRGQSRVHPEAEPGHIIKAMRRAKSRNPVILLDEIDRVSPNAYGEIMGVLVELLDPEQNMAFTDHFLDYPFDLSQVLFICTSNNTANISTAVMDRLEPILMPSYSDDEKLHIARDYILPHQLKNSSLPPHSLVIQDSVWPKIIRPMGFDAGIRSVERTIEGITRKAARLMVEGKGTQFTITEDNIKEFLPKY